VTGLSHLDFWETLALGACLNAYRAEIPDGSKADAIVALLLNVVDNRSWASGSLDRITSVLRREVPASFMAEVEDRLVLRALAGDDA
jgi:hypothetical protein